MEAVISTKYPALTHSTKSKRKERKFFLSVCVICSTAHLPLLTFLTELSFRSLRCNEVVMGSRGGSSLMAFLLILFSLLSPSCEAADTLKQGEVLRDNQTLISANGVYALGFFSPGTLSSNRYLGIWYEKFSRGLILWVANRENPGTDSSGVFRVTEEGNLVILDGRGSAIWSGKALQARFSATNATLALLDSGNLVLRDGSGVRFWESFWFPTDTLLPGMRIQLNLRTAENRILQSWKYVDDPAPGMYSFGVDPQRSRQLVAWRESLSIWRSGLWNGWTFRGLDASKYAEVNFSVIGDDEQISYSYYFVNQSIVSRFIMGIDGQLRILTWNDEKRAWDEFWSFRSTNCDVYNRCQEFGICKNRGQGRCQCLTGFGTGDGESSEETNWPERCERQSPLKCGLKDEFQKVPQMKLPDGFLTTNASTVERCEEQCRGNCSCPAYAFADIGGKTNTCLIWDGRLVDITEYVLGGDDLYLRLVKPDHTGSENGSSSTTVIVVATVIPGVICFSTVIFCLWKFKKRKPGRGGREEEMSMFSGLRNRVTAKAGEASKSADLPFMDFHCIAIATDNFAVANKLGEGGFGPVYKGKLMDGQIVAVKRLSRSSGQGLEEFKNEVILICKLQHRNLVRLLGCCVEEDEKLLVYEYLPNKSLDKWLFDQGRSATLDWPKRVQIITGIARGLLYLHHDSRLRIIHRDLKPSNILLDEEMNPKISDFGMARIFGGNQVQANTNRVVGTYGYMSPEYAMKGLFSVKSDVFGYGVLLLEIVTGKRNNNSLNLLEHVWRLWNEEGRSQLADPCIRESCPIVELTRYVHVGLLCVQEKADDRPTMPSVVVMLGSETAVLPPPKQPAFCYGGNATDSDSSSNRGMKGGGSINEMSITMLEGR